MKRMIAVLAMVALAGCDEAPTPKFSPLNFGVSLSTKEARTGDALQWDSDNNRWQWCQLPPSKIDPRCVPAVVESEE